MSIATHQWYPVSKADLRVESYGSVDEPGMHPGAGVGADPLPPSQTQRRSLRGPWQSGSISKRIFRSKLDKPR